MATDNRKVQLGITVSDETKAGLDSVKSGVRKGMEVVAKEADKASKAMDGLGGSADGAAKKLDAGTRSLIAQIQRVTAETQAGAKGTEDYFKAIAQQRGIPQDALTPYLQQLAAAKAAQDTAARSMNNLGMTAKQTTAALRQVPAQFTDIVVSLAGGQAPMTVLLQQGGQLKDVFGGVGAAARAMGGYIAGLVNPVNAAVAAVAVMAYGYAKGSEEASKFANTLVTTGNMLGLTAQELVTMAASVDAMSSSVTQSRAAEVLDQLAASGKVGAENFKRFALAAAEYELAGGQAASETVKAFVELGKAPLDATLKLGEASNYLTLEIYEQVKALEQQGRFTDAARVAQEAYASAIEQRTPAMLSNLGYVERAWKGIKDVAREALDQILEIGRSNPLGDIETQLQNAYASGASDAEIASLESKYKQIKKLVDAEKERAKAVSDTAAREKASVQLAEQAANADGQLATQRKKVAEATDLFRKATAGLVAGSAEYTRAEKEYLAVVTSIVKVEKDRKSAGGGNGAAERELKARADLLAKLAGVNTDYVESLARIADMRKKGEVSEERANELLRELIENQPMVVAQRKAEADAVKAQADAIKKLEDARAKELQQVGGIVSGLQDRAAELENEVALYGMSEEALAQRQIGLLEERKAIIELFDPQSQLIELLDAEIDARKRIAAAKDSLKNKKEADTAAKKAQDEWERAAQKIEDTLTDALMRGFESGEDAARVLRDTVVNMFKTMVLRPVVQGVVQIGLDAVGLGGLGGSGGGGALGMANNAYSQYNMLSTLPANYSALSSWASGSMSGANAYGSLFANATNTGIDGLLATNGAYGTAGQVGMGLTAGSAMGGLGGAYLGYQLTGGNWGGAALGGVAGYGAATGAATGVGAAAGATGALASIGPWGWAAIAGLALFGDDLFGNAGTPHTGGVGSYSAAQGALTGSAADQWVNFDPNKRASAWNGEANTASATIAQITATSLDAFATAFGQQAGYLVGTGFQDDSSSDGAWGALKIALGDEVLLDWGRGNDKWPGREFANGQAGQEGYMAALATDVRDLLVDIAPDWADAMLNALGDDVSLEGLSAVTAEIARVQAALVAMADVMPQLAGLSDDATTGLLGLFGGIDNLAAATGAYFQNFYSAQEQFDAKSQRVQDALHGMDIGGMFDATRAEFEALVSSTSRENYRLLVEAQDLTTESGRATYAALLQLSPAFAEVTYAIDATTSAAADAAGTISQVMQGLLDERSSLEREYEILKSGSARAVDTAGMTAAEVAAYDYNEALRAQVQTLQDAKDAAEAAAEAEASRISALQDEGKTLQRQLLELRGGDVRAFDIAGMSAAEVALYDYNEALRAQITALQDAQQAADAAEAAAASRAQAVANERDGLERQLLQLQGDTTAIRAAERAALDASNRSLYDRITALQDAKEAEQAAAAVASERAGLDKQLLQLQGDTAAIRALERSALDETNRAIYDRITALQDAQAAEQAAARIAQERTGLERQLLQLQGDTAAIRALDLAQLDASNQALQQQIWALQDAQDAANSATSAAGDFATAWQQVTQSLVDEAKRIRGILAEDSAMGYAALQSQFAIATAQARAGDATAAKDLTGYASSLIAAATDQAGSRLELVRLRASVAQSLDDTSVILGNVAPVANTAQPIDELVQANQDLNKTVLELKAELIAMKAHLAEIKGNTRETADATNGNGRAPMLVEIDA